LSSHEVMPMLSTCHCCNLCSASSYILYLPKCKVNPPPSIFPFKIHNFQENTYTEYILPLCAVIRWHHIFRWWIRKIFYSQASMVFILPCDFLTTVQQTPTLDWQGKVLDSSLLTRAISVSHIRQRPPCESLNYHYLLFKRTHPYPVTLLPIGLSYF
jgi:hypothetical protein